MDKIELKTTALQDRFDEYSPYVLSGGYVYDSENEPFVKKLISVLDKNEVGALVLGNAGSGKTLVFEMAQRIINPTAKNSFLKVNVLDVVLSFNDKEIGHKVYKRWLKDNVLFDDLGTEEVGFLYQKIEVMKDMIQHRYELFRRTGIKTHFTSNLNYEQLKERYGVRCVSRLNEMCEVIIIGGSKNYTDRRALKNFKGLPQIKYETEAEESVNYVVYKENREKDLLKQEQENLLGLGQRLKNSMGYSSDIQTKMEEFKKKQGIK